MKRRIKKNIKKIISKIKFPLIDIGSKDKLIILSGMGRSGTTWGSDVINYDNSYRVLFEPFLPAKVKEVKGFEYIQYINPNVNNISLANQAKTILSGKIRNNWVDKGNSRSFYRRRILKDIRCNLMLGWLKNIANNPHIVIMMRHPLQVASSWKKLGWGMEVTGERSDLDIILSQKSLLKDFPIIEEIEKEIDFNDFIQKIVFEWCILYLVPLSHLNKGEAHVLYYENLVKDRENEIVKLFQYLNMPFNEYKLKGNMIKPSSTNYLKRDFNKKKNKDLLLNSWKEEFSPKQIQSAMNIMARFGLDNIYDTNGFPTGAYKFSD